MASAKPEVEHSTLRPPLLQTERDVESNQKSPVRTSLDCLSVRSSKALLGSTSRKSSKDILSTSPLTYLSLVVARQKHILLAGFMKILLSRWKGSPNRSIITCGGSNSQPFGPSSQPSVQQSSSQKGRGKGNKRNKNDEDDNSPSEENGKRGKKSRGREATGLKDSFYACPFHKRNPRKYCRNDMTDLKYKSCQTARYKQISHLR